MTIEAMHACDTCMHVHYTAFLLPLLLPLLLSLPCRRLPQWITNGSVLYALTEYSVQCGYMFSPSAEAWMTALSCTCYPKIRKRHSLSALRRGELVKRELGISRSGQRAAATIAGAEAGSATPKMATPGRRTGPFGGFGDRERDVIELITYTIVPDLMARA